MYAASSGTGGCPSDCSDNGLCLTNYYRSLHGAPPLTYDTTLQSQSQVWMGSSYLLPLQHDGRHHDLPLGASSPPAPPSYMPRTA